MRKASTWIAVIDDDEAVRRALIRLLRSAGLEAHAFKSGELFLESLSKKRPACLLLDLQMPEMSGFAVIEKLKQFAVGLPVIVLTGQDISEKQTNGDLTYPLAVLQKPVNDEELLTSISAALTYFAKQN